MKPTGKTAGRLILFGVIVCAAIGVIVSKGLWNDGGVSAAQQARTGVWVDPENPSDELVAGPYRVDANWPKPLATLFPEEKGWTWGAVQGVFAENPDRVFVAMRGELPDLTGMKPEYAEIETRFGMTAHLHVPVWGLYARNTTVGAVRQPGRAPRTLHGRRRGRTTGGSTSSPSDGQGNLVEAWTQWDSLFKPQDIPATGRGPRAQDLHQPVRSGEARLGGSTTGTR